MSSDEQDRSEHIAGDHKGREAGEQPEEEEDAADKFRECGDVAQASTALQGKLHSGCGAALRKRRCREIRRRE